MNVKDFSEKLQDRIEAHYQARLALLGDRAGVDRIKDCKDSGYIQALKDFTAWINEAITDKSEKPLAPEEDAQGPDYFDEDGS